MGQFNSFNQKINKKYFKIFALFLIFIIIIISSISYVYTNFLANQESVKSSPTEKTLGIQYSPTKEADISTNIPTEIPTSRRINKVKLGIVIDDYKNQNQSLSSLTNRLDSNINTISIFKQFGNEFNKDFSSSDLDYAKNNNIKVLVAWEPWNPDEGNSQSKDYLTEISTGAQDNYIKKFANDIKNYGNPVIIRFGHEMNGDWYPWGKRPSEYISAYNYIYEIFKNENVTNVKWMWSVNISNNPKELSLYYPGNHSIDIIGIDGFNFGDSSNFGGWITFSQLFEPTYIYLSNNYSKTLIISETATTERGGNKALWIKDMISDLNTKFINIDEIIWFNLIKETDWRIDSTGSSFNAFNAYF